jgi:pimeloyl-ACP methyl ester carboxylesterase
MSPAALKAGEATVSREQEAPLLLLPGTLCDADVFGPMLKALGSPQAIVADMSLSADLATLVDQILQDAPPRFWAVGFSLGGIAALKIAICAPERVLGLVLIASTADAIELRSIPARRDDVAWARRGELALVVSERLWPRYVAKAHQNDEALRLQIVKMAERLGADVFARQTELAISRPDQRPHLHQIRAPTLILAGADDEVVSLDRQGETAALLANSELRIISNAGHFLLLESPNEAAHRIVEWRSRHATRSILNNKRFA